MSRFKVRYREPEQARKELRRELLVFAAVFLACSALVAASIISDVSTKYGLIVRVATGLAVLVVLPASACSTAFAWLRRRRFG